MIPLINTTKENLQITSIADKTYKLDFDTDKCRYNITGIEALKQSIYKILMTDKYRYLIYSHSYGLDLNNLHNIHYIKVELPRRIREAIMIDDRVEDVTDFEFTDTKDKSSVSIRFRVKSIYGNFEMERSDINV